jgi:hypothetical protein
MQKQRSFSEYRNIDLVLFAVMLAVSETLIVNASVRWFPMEAYTVSVVGAITSIVMMRWGFWAGMHAFFGGIVYCFASGAGPRHYIVYCVGNLFSLIAMAMVKLLGKEAIRDSAAKSVIFALIVTVLMQLGRGLMSMLFGSDILDAFGFVTTDALSLVFSAVIVWIARRLDGIFEDQKHYLLRLKEAERKEKGGTQ